jgi:hypothetical protein
VFEVVKESVMNLIGLHPDNLLLIGIYEKNNKHIIPLINALCIKFY